MKKLFFLILSFFMAANVYAAFPSSTVKYIPSSFVTGNQFTNTFLPTRLEACEYTFTNSGSVSAYQQGSYSMNGNQCVILRTNGTHLYTYTAATSNVPAYCPADSTLSNGECTCTAPKVQNSTNDGCETPVNPCTAKIGIPRITNFTYGYTRTSDEQDYSIVGAPTTVPTDGTLCDGGCVVERGSGAAAWRSLTPTSQGLYRLSIDFNTVPTGAQCTVGTAGTAGATNPLTPPPTCPGYVGEVNGKLGCFGTADKPVTTTTGSTGGQAPKPGNPAAGEKPATGEGSGSTGSGRTPSAGSGGNNGGPSAAAQGPSGNVISPPSGEQQAACGAPGQPKCGIDESGTPDGKDTLTGKHGEFDDKLGEREAALSTVTSSSGKDTSWGIVPAWTQAGTCTAWHIFSLPPALGGFSVDVDLCPIKPLADGVANFIWVFLAIFAITGMIFKTMTSGGN